MIPVWAAILIGLGGGIAATLLSIAHQRGAEFRTRQLDAAASLLQAAEAVRRATRRPRAPDTDRNSAATLRYATG